MISWLERQTPERQMNTDPDKDSIYIINTCTNSYNYEYDLDVSKQKLEIKDFAPNVHWSMTKVGQTK